MMADTGDSLLLMLTAFEVLILKLAALETGCFGDDFWRLTAFDVWDCFGDYMLETDSIWCLRLLWRLHVGDWLHLMFETALETTCWRLTTFDVWGWLLGLRCATDKSMEVRPLPRSTAVRWVSVRTLLNHLHNSRHRRTSMQQLLSSFFLWGFFSSLGLLFPFH